MPRPIVCGVDGSHESLAALNVATSLARQLESRLVVAHAPESGDDASRRIRDDLGDLSERRILDGDPADSLAELAENEDAILVAVGSRGRGPLRSALFGSTSRELIQRLTRPVLVVTPAAAANPRRLRMEGRSVVCGVDASGPATAAAAVATDLAAMLERKLVLVHWYESIPAVAAMPAPAAPAPIDHAQLRKKRSRAAEAVLDAVASGVDAQHPFTTVAEAGHPVLGLTEAVDEHDADLIVVGTHGHGALAAALLGSTSARLARTASAPVLVVREGAERPLRKTAGAPQPLGPRRPRPGPSP